MKPNRESILLTNIKGSNLYPNDDSGYFIC